MESGGVEKSWSGMVGVESLWIPDLDERIRRQNNTET